MDTKLNLPLPEDLPIQHQLDKDSQEKLSSSLNLMLRSQTADFTQAILQVERALEVIDTANTSPWDASKNTKKLREAQDYDNYFNISHIKSDQPEITLVRSILVAYRRFLLLTNQSSELDLKYIETQQQGFLAYVRLVSRVFNLSLNYNYAED